MAPVMPGEPICGIEGPPDSTVSVCMESPDHMGTHRDDDGNEWRGSESEDRDYYDSLRDSVPNESEYPEPRDDY